MPSTKDPAVDAYLASLDEATRADADVLWELLRRITGHDPTLWNAGTLGFGTYRYEHDSGRSGEGHMIGFYPRKAKTTIYLMDGTARHAALLARLGKHTTTGYCVVIKRLADVDPAVLEELLRASYARVAAEAKDGPVRRILWKDAPA